jgi:hypothetical protein
VPYEGRHLFFNLDLGGKLPDLVGLEVLVGDEPISTNVFGGGRNVDEPARPNCAVELMPYASKRPSSA